MINQSNLKKDTSFTWFIIFALVVSLYFPSSIGGSIIEQLSLLGNILALAILLLGVFFCRVPLDKSVFFLGLIFILIITCLSFFSPFDNMTLGSVVPYLTMLFIVSLVYKNIGISRAQLKFLLFFAIFQLTLAFMIVFSFTWLKNVLESYYQMVPDLYFYMIGWENKPVITYATHSVAGFVFFLFSLFFIVLYYRVRGTFLRMLFMFLSLLYCSLLILIFSNTGFFLLVAMLIAYFYLSMKNSGIFFRMTLLVILALLTLYILVNYYEVIMLASEKVLEVLTSDKNGIIARLSMNSRLAGSYQYVFDNPLQGVGFTYDGNIAFGDNFVSEYVLRGGFLSYFVYILIACIFCLKNVQSRVMAILLLLFIFISDFGYPLLVAYRFVFFFPVIIVFMNYLHRELYGQERLRIYPR